MPWPDGEVVVFSFSDGTKPLAAGEIPVFDFGTPISVVTTKEGSLTGCALTFISSPDGTTGPGFGNNTLSFPPFISSESMGDACFCSTAGTNNIQLIFSGVPAGVYNIVVAASRNVADTGTDRQCTVTFTGTTTDAQLLDAANPASGSVAPHVSFNGFEASSGNFTLDIVATSLFGYLGAFAIYKVPPAPPASSASVVYSTHGRSRAF